MSFRLRYPCEPNIVITQYFMDNPTIYARFGLPGHDGLDFGTPLNSPVYAAADGTVLFVGFEANGYGNWIKLVHHHDDGIFETIVAHLNQTQVRNGQTVRAGEVIGLSGNTGFSTGPHLHFSLQLRGATNAGFSQFRGFGRTVTFPRDFIDPAPWLIPPTPLMPVQPVSANHPSLQLSDSSIPADERTVRVVTDIDNLRVRHNPSTAQAPVTELKRGTVLTVNAVDLVIGAIAWRRITEPNQFRGRWVASRFNNTIYLIEQGEATEESGTVIVAPGENPRDPSVPVSKPSPDAVGMRVINTGAFGGVAVRAQPATNNTPITRLTDGTTFWVRPTTRENNNIRWRQLLTPVAHRDRWIAENFMQERYLERIADADVVSDGASAPPPADDSVPMVVVNTGVIQLNVRTAPNITAPAVTKLPDGTTVRVRPTANEAGNITWRQLVTPEAYAGHWVAQRFGTTPYLISPPGTGTGVSGSGSGSGFAAQDIDAPAPLTGRFKLVNRGTFTSLAIDGDTRPQLGVNVRELAYFGTPKWQWAAESLRRQFCEEAKNLGMKWLRFYAPHKDHNLDDTVRRVRAALDAAASADLLAVVVFGDSLAETGLYPQGDDSYHVEAQGHLIKSYWHDKGYERGYMTLVKRIVSEFRSHPGVGMWQLMNEPAIYPQPASQGDANAFAAFVDYASSEIYKLDTVHPISMGIVNIAHIAPSGVNLEQYAADFMRKRKHIHLITCHAYQDLNNGDSNRSWEQENRANVDAKAAMTTGRAYMLTEFGASHAGNRTAATEAFLRRQLQANRSSGALQWGFMPTGQDVGVGDRLYGMSRANINSEYDGLANLYRNIRNLIHLT